MNGQGAVGGRLPIWAVLLWWLGLLAIATTGLGAALVGELPRPQQTVELAFDRLPIAPLDGLAYEVNLEELGLAFHSDREWVGQVEPRPSGRRLLHRRSRLMVLEEGQPLLPHASRRDLRNHRGLFSHWGDTLGFSTLDGSDPRTNGRRYQLRYPEPDAGWDRLEEVLLTADGWLARLAVVGLLVLTGLHGRGLPIAQGLGARLALIIALACTLIGQQWPGFGRAYVAPDSPSYVQGAQTWSPGRHPGYPAFIRAVAPVDRAQSAVARGLDEGQYVYGDPHHPLARVVIAQRLAVTGALLIFHQALTGLVAPPLAALLTLAIGSQEKMPGEPLLLPNGLLWVVMVVSVVAFGWRRLPVGRMVPPIGGLLLLSPVMWFLMRHATLFSAEADFILSEPLAMAANLLVAALVVSYLRRGEVRWLPLLAVGCGAAWLVRPAEGFVFGMMALALLHALLGSARHRRVAVVAALLLVWLAVQSPRWVAGGGESAPAVGSGVVWSLAATALQVAREGDVALLDDPAARSLLVLAQARKPESDAAIGAGRAGWEYLNANLYGVLIPLLAATPMAADPDGSLRLAAMVKPLLLAHWRDYLELVGQSFRDGFGSRSRIGRAGRWWQLVGGVLILGWVVPRSVGVVAGILLAGHVGHLAVVAAFDQPLVRYVHATEFLAVIALFLLIVEALRILFKPRLPWEM